MHYALWELRTNNLIRAFENEHDALAAALRFIELNGQDSIANLSLTVEEDQGEGIFIAYGSELLKRARREFAAGNVAEWRPTSWTRSGIVEQPTSSRPKTTSAMRWNWF